MSQPVSSIMQSTVVPVSMDDTVEEVEALMQSHHISSAPVYDVGALIGIITASDLIKFQAMGKDPKTVKAWEICTYRPFEVAPDTPIGDVAELMLSHKIHHIVVMEKSSLQGIVSSLDFVKLFVEQNKQ